MIASGRNLQLKCWTVQSSFLAFNLFITVKNSSQIHNVNKPVHIKANWQIERLADEIDGHGRDVPRDTRKATKQLWLDMQDKIQHIVFS